jgi:hypothetical protein
MQLPFFGFKFQLKANKFISMLFITYEQDLSSKARAENAYKPGAGMGVFF